MPVSVVTMVITVTVRCMSVGATALSMDCRAGSLSDCRKAREAPNATSGQKVSASAVAAMARGGMQANKDSPTSSRRPSTRSPITPPTSNSASAGVSRKARMKP